MVPLAVILAVVAGHPVIRAAGHFERLGNPRFGVREVASRELILSGRAAIPVLRRGLVHPDAEVAERSRRLMPAAADFAAGEQARLIARQTAFLQTWKGEPPGSTIPADLPWARRFLTLTGDTWDARHLYAEMYAAHPRVLEDLALAAEQGGTLFWAYVDSQLIFVDGRRNVELWKLRYARADFALYWLLSADPGLTVGTCPALARTDFAFFRHASAEQHMTGPRADPLARLLAAWLAGPRNYADKTLETRDVTAALDIVDRCRLDCGRAPALRIAADRARTPAGRAKAALVLAAAGRREDAALLDPIVTETESVPNGSGGTVQLGDVALACAVRLEGRSLSDFWFAPEAGRVLSESGLASDLVRHIARKTWATRGVKP